MPSKLTATFIQRIETMFSQSRPPLDPKNTLESFNLYIAEIHAASVPAKEKELSTLISLLTDKFPPEEQAKHINLLADLIRIRFTPDFLIENAILWNNPESSSAFYTLAQRMGSQSENLLIKHISTYATTNDLNPHQIHRLLQIHLLWLPLPLDRTQPPHIRSAIALFEADPISLEPILSAPFEMEDGSASIPLKPPFSHTRFHDLGIRVCTDGMVFLSRKDIVDLNGTPRAPFPSGETQSNTNPHGRPNVNTSVVSLTSANLDIALIQRYYAFWQLVLSHADFLDMPIERCLTALIERKILSDDYQTTQLSQVIDLCLPYLRQSAQQGLDSILAARIDPRISSNPVFHLIPPEKLDDNVITVLNSVVQNTAVVPLIVHLLRVGFDSAALKQFTQALRNELRVNWTSGYCIDFLLQIPACELTPATINFLTHFSSSHVSDRNIALTLQNRFQFVLWFGNDETNFSEIAVRFFEGAHNAYLCPAMIRWMNQVGKAISPTLTIENIITFYCENTPIVEWNHTALLSVVRQTATQLSAQNWHLLFQYWGTLPVREHTLIHETPVYQALLICKTTILKGGTVSLTDWIRTQRNDFAFAQMLVDQFFQYQLLTAHEAATLYYTPGLRALFPRIIKYFENLQTQFTDTAIRLIGDTATTTAKGDGSPVQDKKTIYENRKRVFADARMHLDTYRQAQLYASTPASASSDCSAAISATVVYEPKGVLFGTALFAREVTRDSARAFNRLYAPVINVNTDAVHDLLQDSEFQRQTRQSASGSFWGNYCRAINDSFSQEKIQFQRIAQNPAVLAHFLFDAHLLGFLDKFSLSQLLRYCAPAIRSLIEEFIVFVRGGYGFDGVVRPDSTTLITADDLSASHPNPVHVTTSLPITVAMPSSPNPQPADAQTAESKPVDQWNMSKDALYQYADPEILSGEQALAFKFQSRIINFPDNTRTVPLDISNPTLFYLVRPSTEFVLLDPLSDTRVFQTRFNTFQRTLRSLVNSYDPNNPRHTAAIVFAGIVSTGVHYIPYVIGKCKTGQVFVFTVDPSAQTALLGSIEYKPNGGVTPKGDKELAKRAMRRFFTHTLPGCVYDDVYVTQMLRERDCGPLSLYTLHEILSGTIVQVTDHHVIFNARALSIQSAPSYANGEQYFYPSALEASSIQARAHWTTTFETDPYNFAEMLVRDDGAELLAQPSILDRVRSEGTIPNEDTYQERATRQYNSDRRQQHQSELSVYLSIETRAFARLKEKLSESGQLPTHDEIMAFISAINDEINSDFPAQKDTWNLLYSTYLTLQNDPNLSNEENQRNRNNHLASIRDVVIYNLNDTIKAELLNGFRDFIQKNRARLSDNTIDDNIALFLQQPKQLQLYGCCTLVVKQNLEIQFREIATQAVIQKYIHLVLEQALTPNTIVRMLAASYAPETNESNLIWEKLLSEVNSTEHPELYQALHYLNTDSIKSIVLARVTDKIRETYIALTEKTMAAIKERYQDIYQRPDDYLHARILFYDNNFLQLIHELLPRKGNMSELSQQFQGTLIYDRILQHMLPMMERTMLACAVTSLNQKIAAFCALPETKGFFDTLQFEQLCTFFEMSEPAVMGLSSDFYVHFALENRIVASTQEFLSTALYTAISSDINQNLIFLQYVLTRRNQLFATLASKLGTKLDTMVISDILHDPTAEVSLATILQKLITQYGRDADVENANQHFFVDNVLTPFGNQFIHYLREISNPLLQRVETINQHYHFVFEKLATLKAMITEYSNCLREGGYKGRRNDVLAILKHAEQHCVQIQTLIAREQTLPYKAFVIQLESHVSDLLRFMSDISAQLIKLLRAGNCDPQSTTQPLRALLCQLLNVRPDLQDAILTEITAKIIDAEITRRHLLLTQSPVRFELLGQFIAPTTQLIVITPNEAKRLPEQYECEDVLRLSVRCVMWWRENHHSISTLTAGNFLDRARAPGGLSPIMSALINTINRANTDNIETMLCRFMADYPELPGQKRTNSMMVIHCLRENLDGFVFIQNAAFTLGSLQPIMQANDPHLLRIQQKHNGNPDAPLDIHDARQLIVHLTKRWEQLCAKQQGKQPQNYLMDADHIDRRDNAYVSLAKMLAKQLSINADTHFKLPAAFLMPGSVYDQLIETRYRDYAVCPRLQTALYMDEGDSVNTIDEIPMDQLLIIDSVPMNMEWFQVAAGFNGLTTLAPDTRIGALHHPITFIPYTEQQIMQLTTFGEKGLALYCIANPGIPTKRSLHALARFLHVMILDGGGSLNYNDAHTHQLNHGYEILLKTITSYPVLEQNVFWNTEIPGTSSRQTIESTLGRSITTLSGGSNSCSHGTGRLLALVIHQYFSNADSMVPYDAIRGNMGMFQKEFIYLDANRKTPLPDNAYASTVEQAPSTALARVSHYNFDCTPNVISNEWKQER
ncbi:MAG: hypothetical protein A3F13_08795 [Gammaproteobacteria bacterium RIFCSPHIGHO2_12_FULL_40_19]|nr:MAG: hypothetical protein A3F13_08795 [Gammaproteobacteria bacterium RIFCSPHIGHO2_12_FULL_40_19]